MVALEFVTHRATGRLRISATWDTKLLATMNAGWVTGVKTRALGDVLQQAMTMTTLDLADMKDMGDMDMARATDGIAMEFTTRNAILGKSIVTLVMIRWVAGTATTVSKRRMSMMVAMECVDRIATMKLRTGVIWDLTPMGVGWAIGARTKAWEDVHLPIMRWLLVRMSAPTWTLGMRYVTATRPLVI